jgi:hypothetical protein
MTDKDISNMILHYQELAEVCDRIEFEKAAMMWRFRAKQLSPQRVPEGREQKESRNAN